MLTHAQIEPRPSAWSELFSRGRVHAWPRPFRANQRRRRHCVDAGDARYPRPLRSRRLERRRAPPRHCSPVCSGGLTGAMYESGSDPYCYPGSSVFKNRLDLRDQAELDAFESLITAQRAEEPLPGGRLGYAHYRAIHHHLFQDVFDWAGKPRIVRIAKGGSMFCYPEHIDGEMRKLFARLSAERLLRGLSAGEFARRSAHVLAELNAIHPFREGNGRAQLTYLTLLAARAAAPPAHSPRRKNRGHTADFETWRPPKAFTPPASSAPAACGSAAPRRSAPRSAPRP